MTRNLGLLTQETRVNIVFDESVDTGEPVISSDQLESSGNTAVVGKRCVIVLM